MHCAPPVAAWKILRAYPCFVRVTVETGTELSLSSFSVQSAGYIRLYPEKPSSENLAEVNDLVCTAFVGSCVGESKDSSKACDTVGVGVSLGCVFVVF